MKAALMENGKKLIGCDNYISTVLSKSKDIDSSPPNTHLPIEKRDSQSSVSTQSSGSTSGSNTSNGPVCLIGSLDVVDGELASKPHKPLARVIQDIDGCHEEVHHTPLHRPRADNKDLIRPQTKALQRPSKGSKFCLFGEMEKVKYGSVIKFLHKKGTTNVQIKAPSLATVKFWKAEFVRGRTSVFDYERPGRPNQHAGNDQQSPSHDYGRSSN
ncbi:unnamed protein product [Diabrotica balteata]|uniref:Uncharacterized protein n=1 Tax=Diabrotica balteata TaxID=107213 RepID=A0A9N9XA18_DIABA|nr:unnamed protein product [Diabrotica balteata]